jgi:hypothetical protein
MKSSTKGLFVILLIVMSFFAVSAVFAITGIGENNPGYGNNDPGKPEGGIDICTNSVTGEITYLIEGYGAIVIDDEITIYGLPVWLGYELGDNVTVTYWVSPDGKNVACSLTFN